MSRAAWGVVLAIGLVAIVEGAAARPPVARPFVAQLAIDPRTPQVIYAATLDGVFKSTNGGSSWRRSSRGLTGRVLSVAVAPTRPKTVYAGSTDGVWRSADGGDTWAGGVLVGRNWFPIRIAIDAGSWQIAYAAINVFFGNHAPLYRSADAGRSWTPAARRLGGGAIWSLAVDPSRPGTLYASNAAGLFKSTDRAATWRRLGPFRDWVAEVAVDPVVTTTLYAADSTALYKSTDGGNRWRRLPLGLAKGEVVAEIVVDPRDRQVVCAATTSQVLVPSIGVRGVYRSGDGGAAWTRVLTGRTLGVLVPSAEGNEITSLVVDPTRPRILVSTHAGVWRSLDGGMTWRPANSGLGGT